MPTRYVFSSAATLALTAFLLASTHPAAGPPAPQPGTIVTVAGNGKLRFLS